MSDNPLTHLKSHKEIPISPKWGNKCVTLQAPHFDDPLQDWWVKTIWSCRYYNCLKNTNMLKYIGGPSYDLKSPFFLVSLVESIFIWRNHSALIKTVGSIWTWQQGVFRSRFVEDDLYGFNNVTLFLSFHLKLVGMRLPRSILIKLKFLDKYRCC